MNDLDSTAEFRDRLPERGGLEEEGVGKIKAMLLAVFLVTVSLVVAANGGEPTELRHWNEYRAIMWVGDSAWKDPEKAKLFMQRLREMNIDTGMVHGRAQADALKTNGFPYYVENMVNRGLCLKWNSNVRDWDKFVTEWAKNGREESGMVRDYSLDDLEWRGWARGEMQDLVRAHRNNAPLAYDIRDELSTTISANPFDYDFGPATLSAFRLWLKGQYGDLAALNAGWDTRFKSWDEVKPFTTDQVKNRMANVDGVPRGKPDWQALAKLKFDPVRARSTPARWNLAPWADFRTYMDIALATTLDELRAAARELDPRTPVGVEGTQMPHAFGGYDLWRLSQALDWVEPYDIGNAREIFGSFMPQKTILCTVFEKETNPAKRRLWHLLLEGDRGCIIWWSEDCFDWKSPDIELTSKAKALAPVLGEMKSPLARLFLSAARVRDPIFVHYSQPSIQVNWLLESTVDGPSWIRRFSSYEASHNRLAKVRNSWLKIFQDLGYSPEFLSTAQIEDGALRTNGAAVLVLPGSLALSDRETKELADFLQGRGGAGDPVMFCDGAPGVFNAHGKLRPNPFWESLPGVKPAETAGFVVRKGKAEMREEDIARYAAERLKTEPSLSWLKWVAAQLPAGQTEITVPPDARVRVHRFRVPQGRLIAFERNINYHMSEDLKQAGGNEALEKPMEFEAKLAARSHVYDLRAQKYLGRVDRIRVSLSPWEPSLFALTAEPLPGNRSVLEALQPSQPR